MDNLTPSPVPADQLDASFDIVARQDAADAAIGALRSDVDDVRTRLDRVSRAASRPALEGAAPAASLEVKSFVDGYLRAGRESEVKSLSGAAPADGQAWIVGPGASGAWAGKDGQIAYRHSGQWLFFPAHDGMRLWNRTARQDWRYSDGAWLAPAAPAAPSGGATVDIEARAAIVNLLQTLHSAGLLA